MIKDEIFDRVNNISMDVRYKSYTSNSRSN